jgi:hypothetical protein
MPVRVIANGILSGGCAKPVPSLDFGLQNPRRSCNIGIWQSLQSHHKAKAVRSRSRSHHFCSIFKEQNSQFVENSDARSRTLFCEKAFINIL